MFKKKISKILIVFLCLILVILLYITAGYFNLKSCKLVAHRGYGFKDNSIESFSNSKDFDCIECDVRLTKDKEFVINHDATIKLNGEEKLISECDLTEIVSGGGNITQLFINLQKFKQNRLHRVERRNGQNPFNQTFK